MVLLSSSEGIKSEELSGGREPEGTEKASPQYCARGTLSPVTGLGLSNSKAHVNILS